MEAIGKFIGGIVMIVGVAGLVHELTGWFRLWAVVQYVDVLGGHEIVANVALIVVGFLVVMGTEHMSGVGNRRTR